MQRIPIILFGAACLQGLPAAAHASDKGAEITASVPEVCRFEAAPIEIDQGSGVVLSRALESCNSNRSYAITANTRTLSGKEAIVLRFGQAPISLNENGSTLIKRSQGPSYRVSDLRLEAEALDEPLTVTLAMVAV